MEEVEEEGEREREREMGRRERQWGTPVARTCVRFSAVNELRLVGGKEHEGCGNVLLKGHARPRICRNHSGIVSRAEAI